MERKIIQVAALEMIEREKESVNDFAGTIAMLERKVRTISNAVSVFVCTASKSISAEKHP